MFDQLSDVNPLKIGGQKEVFSAVHSTFGAVVYKKIKPNADAVERTKREVRAASLIKSQFVPKIYAHNCDEDNPSFLWLIEERISGSTLRELLKEGRIFNINEIVNFLKSMLAITIETEKNNLVHRDIKPDNIILNDEGEFWLLDYGIARHLDLESITDSNSPFGAFTVGYASSEQFRNLKKEIDIRSDLFSIGIVSYEMIKGENFYISGTGMDVMKILKKLENSSIPPLLISGDTQFQLSAFIKMLGDHRRTRRPRSAKEALEILSTIIDTLKLN
ncbi:MAG: serine/threonine protein kinase [Saprospiraceae bacterium]|nr:serine/threonine protein kinase [Saprospiraceae bacterium]